MSQNIVVAYQNEKFKNHIKYTFDLIFSTLGIPWKFISYEQLRNITLFSNSLIISYGKEKPKVDPFNHIHIYESNLFGSNYLKIHSLPKIPLPRYKNIPIIYQGNGDLSDWVIFRANEFGKKIIETNIDIIASSFFMVTRYEEIIVKEKDRFNRFPAKASIAYKENFLDRPIVNEYIDLLWSWIKWFNLGFVRKHFWGNKKFALCLTCDVDSVLKYRSSYLLFRYIAKALLKHVSPKNAFLTLKDFLETKTKQKKDPYDTFDYMLSKMRKFGFKGSFYFISGGRTRYEKRYSLNDSHVQHLINKIQNEGHEIGLHGSFDSYNNFSLMKKEKENLEKILKKNIFGIRQHYLRWKTPNTWQVQEKAGFKYDTTLYFAERAGFRAGFCLPYKPFDVLENRVLNIWELPLTIMEGTFQGYQKFSPEKAFYHMKNLIDTVKKHKGVVVILWHNSSFDNLGGWKGWSYVYEELLQYLSENDPLSDTCYNIVCKYESNI